VKTTKWKVSQQRRELKELTETLHWLETLDIDSGTAILYRFVAERISEITRYLCLLVGDKVSPCAVR
jgi:hypothetical protein